MVHFTACVGGAKSLRSVANKGLLCYNIRYQDGLNKYNSTDIYSEVQLNYIMEKWFYTRKDLVYLTGFSRSLIDSLEHQGEFPKRITIAQNKIIWDAVQVRKWKEAKINADR